MNVAASSALDPLLRCSPSPQVPRLSPRWLSLGFPRVNGRYLGIFVAGRGSVDFGAVVRCGVRRRRVMAGKELRMGTGFADRKEEEKQALTDEGVFHPAVLGSEGAALAEANKSMMSTVGRSSNIVWHECPVGKLERQKLLGQKGCVIWITGLSGSGKSTLACALSRELQCNGHLSYVLDGDNIRHGLNRDLSFKPEDRTENIRRIGEVAKLFADAGIICIASLISPYRQDRDACRAMLPGDAFIEVFMDIPLEVCEARDAKGLYKLARAGKIKGFTGIDDPYEPPLSCEITIQQNSGVCPSPGAMAEQVISYLELNGYLQA